MDGQSSKAAAAATSSLALNANDSELEALLNQARIALTAREKERAEEAKAERVRGSNKPQALSVPLRLNVGENNHLLPLQVDSETGAARLDTHRIYASNKNSQDVAEEDSSEQPSSSSSLPPEVERKIGQYDPTVKRKTASELSGEKEKTAGKRWFGMKAPVMTQELKNDLRVLQLRNVLDPKQFYKKGTMGKQTPKYFEMGTIIEGPTEFYSGRMTKKERRSNLVDELLADKQARDYFKRKVGEIHSHNKSGNRQWYRETAVGGKKRQKFDKKPKRK
ncbi:rrna-processing protein fcf2 [Coemansia sp. Benny D160-2]|nr:rrna-processing protein fcf2 [Coemansia sp. Benny D160-2]